MSRSPYKADFTDLSWVSLPRSTCGYRAARGHVVPVGLTDCPLGPTQLHEKTDKEAGACRSADMLAGRVLDQRVPSGDESSVRTRQPAVGGAARARGNSALSSGIPLVPLRTEPESRTEATV